MEIKVTGETEITISGNIQSIEDYQAIKDGVGSILNKGSKSIILKIPDSLSMPSSVIGFLLKIVHVDSVTITVLIKDERLYNLLEVLNLVSVLNVKKV